MPPFELLDVKLQVPAVGRKLFPLIVPVPVIFRNVALCETTTELARSNLNPPTLQRFGVEVEGLKIHGAVMVTVAPGLTKLAKSPESCRTKELFQVLTRVAVASEVVSKVTTPPKSMLPVIGMAACALGEARRLAMARAARAQKIPGRNVLIISLVRFYPNPCMDRHLDASWRRFFTLVSEGR